MSSINQILNSALMESVLTEGKVQDELDSMKKQKEYVDAQKDDRSTFQQLAGEGKRHYYGLKNKISTNWDSAKDSVTKFDAENPNAKWYAAGTTAALGAGLGALALAKKLRAKKAAAASKK